MPKPMIQFGNKETSSTVSNAMLSANQAQTKEKHYTLSNEELEMLIRKPRSKEYVDFLKKLDIGCEADMSSYIEEWKERVDKEFPMIDMVSNFLLGIISRCYLGDSYEVHMLDKTLSIVGHFKKGEPLPDGLEPCRSIGMNPNYEFVEVYEHMYCIVDKNGNTSVIQR